LSIDPDIRARNAISEDAFSSRTLSNDTSARAITIPFHASDIAYAKNARTRVGWRQRAGELAFLRSALAIDADPITGAKDPHRIGESARVDGRESGYPCDTPTAIARASHPNTAAGRSVAPPVHSHDAGTRSQILYRQRHVHIRAILD